MNYIEQADKLISSLPYFCKSYFDHLKAKRMSYRTIIQYAYDISKFLNWLKEQSSFKNIDFNSATSSDIINPLTIEDIHEYRNFIATYIDKNNQSAEISSAYEARRMASLRSFFKYYNFIGQPKNNLYELIEIPRVEQKEIQLIELSEVKRLIDVIDDTSNMCDEQIKRYEKHRLRDKAITTLLFGTGLRVSEVVNIKLSNVDFYNAVIIVTRKGNKEDKVFFNQIVEDSIIDYLENCRPNLINDKDEDYLFLSNRGKQLTPRSIELLMADLKTKAGVASKVTPHAARRVFGTHVYQETGDIYLTATALNHSSVDTTKKHYAKQNDEIKRRAAKASSTIFDED